jgi:Tfp pilus assembly protein PilO
VTTKFTAGVLAVVVVLVAGWYFALWKPLGHRVDAANTTRTQTEATITSLRGELAAFVTEERHVPADRAALGVLREAVPASPELSGALRDLSAAADATGAVISTITPTPPAAPTSGTTGPTGPTALPLDISATGSYAQLTGFVYRVERLPRLFVVSSLNLSGGSGTQTGGHHSVAPPMQLSVVADMFYQPAAG